MSTTRASVWSITINNPTDSDEEGISQARQRGWKVDGQLEKGENGTLHYQLICRTPQVRFSQVKKAFPRAHIEAAKNPAALDQYVRKEDTRVASMPQSSDAYPSLSKLWDLVYDHIADDIEGPAEEAPAKYFTTKAFDEVIGYLIAEGYHVETMGMNPAIRGAFTRWGPRLMERSWVCRQTDRQTDQNLVAEVNIDAIPSSSVSQEAPRPPHAEGRPVHEPSRICE